MHNRKPNRPHSSARTNNAAPVIDLNHYPFKRYPPEAPVQPGDTVQYMDTDENLLTGIVLAEGSFLSQGVIYVCVRFGDDLAAEAVAAELLTRVFDYEALDAETRIVVQQKTGEIKGLMRQTAQGMFDIGTKLIEVKAKLGHGNFGKWLAAEFDWSERTARNLMRVAEEFKSANFADLRIGPSALALLAAPSTPEEARQEAIQRAEAGEPITYSTAKSIVNEAKGEPPKQPAPQPSAQVASPSVQRPPITPAPAAPVRYSKVEDDYQDDVPSVVVGEEGDEKEYWLDEQLAAKPETVDPKVDTVGDLQPLTPIEPSDGPVQFSIGDKVSTTLGRSGGVVINTSSKLGVYVKFPGSPAFWIEANALVLVEPAPYKQAATSEAKPFAHHLSGSNEWYTPQVYVDAIRSLLGGEISLDPASCEYANRTVRAKQIYHIDDSGLDHAWGGNVFLNPPYGLDENGDSNVAIWASKMLDEYQRGRINGVLLVNATPERKWFQPLWDYPICFTNHRINFYNADGEQKQPTQGNAFVYFGEHAYTFAELFQPFGTIVRRFPR